MEHLKRYYCGYLKENRRYLVKICLLMLVTSMFSQVVGFYGKVMIDTVIQPVAESGSQPNWLLYALLACLYAVTWFTYAAAFYGQNRLTIQFLMKAVVKFRFCLSEKFSKLQMAYFDTHQTGKIAARLFSDVSVIHSSSNQLLTALLSSVIVLLVNFSVMFCLNWKLTLLTLAVLPIYGLTYRSFTEAIRRYTESIRNRNSMLWGLVQERIAGIYVVKCFNQEISEVRKFFRPAREQLREIVRREVMNASLTTICSIIYYSGFILIVWRGVFMLRDGYWTSGEFLWFNSLCLLSFPPFLNIVGVATPLRELRTNLRRVFEVLDEPVTIEDRDSGVVLGNIEGRVRYLNVNLRYSGQSFESLKDINLVVPAGAKVSLLGPSGAGKSSFTSLLQRLYDPSEGYVFLDGYNLKDIKIKSLREKVVRVPQETVIFSGTIAENIRYGRLDATNQQVVEAARAAEMHDFIMSLPEKYESSLGEMGFNLSGGQKQRLALARALVSDPAILILDDTTSALDAETSSRIEDTLSRILEGRTAFVITHRLATAMRADLIVVMDGGRIVETGTHENLMEKKGLYRRIYEQQIGSGSEPAA